MANLPENNLVSQRVRLFDTKHSKDGPSLSDGAGIYYPDGAMRDVNPLGALVEAEPDRWNPGALERRIVYYWQIAVKKAEDDFHRKREDWLLQAKVNQRSKFVQPPPERPSKAANELRALKEEVLKQRKKLNEARKGLDDARPAYYWERQEKSEECAKENSKFIDSVESVQI